MVQVTGTVAANPQAPGGAEIVDPVIEPLTEPAATPPIELWRPTVGAGLPVVLDNAPVALRHPRRPGRLGDRRGGMHGFRRALDGQGFTEIQTPKIVGTATESGANVFALDYFGRPAYLAQSPQFYKQTMVGVFERVFEVGPVFRAEPHDTVRHLAEYVSLDAEFGFIEDHRDVLAVLRDAVAGMLAAVGSGPAGRWSGSDVRLPEIPGEVPVVHFSEALKIAGRTRTSRTSRRRTSGRSASGRGGSTAASFVAVEGYPMAKRPFYTHPQPRTRAGRTRSTCCSAGSSWSRAASGCTATATTSRRWRRRVSRTDAVHVVPAGVQARDAAARRVRDRPRALRGPADRRGEHPRGHAVPARPAPPDPLARSGAGAVRRCPRRVPRRVPRRSRAGGGRPDVARGGTGGA